MRKFAITLQYPDIGEIDDPDAWDIKYCGLLASFAEQALLLRDEIDRDCTRNPAIKIDVFSVYPEEDT